LDLKIQKVWTENSYTKKSEMINVHILCSNCPPRAATHAGNLFRGSPLSNCFINYALVKLVPFLSNPAS